MQTIWGEVERSDSFWIRMSSPSTLTEGTHFRSLLRIGSHSNPIRKYVRYPYVLGYIRGIFISSLLGREDASILEVSWVSLIKHRPDLLYALRLSSPFLLLFFLLSIFMQ